MFSYIKLTPFNFIILIFILKILFISHSYCQNSIFQLNCTDPNFTNELYGEITLLDENNTACECTDFTFEIKTFNALNATVNFGDGNTILVPLNQTNNDTLFTEITHTYCNNGVFNPNLIIENSTCSGEVNNNTEIIIDKIISHIEIFMSDACNSGHVAFIDDSQSELYGYENINSWEWDFGDGLTSTATVHYHFYNSPGNYPVSLSVQSASGCIAQIDTNVVIQGDPDFEILLSNEIVCNDKDITFSYNVNNQDVANINSWNWTFDDNFSSSNETVNRIFDLPGNYEVELEVTTDFGCSGTASIEFEVHEGFTLETSNDTIICNGDTLELYAYGADSYIWHSDFPIIDSHLSNPKVFNESDAVYYVTGTNQNGCEVLDSVVVLASSVHTNFHAELNCLNLTLNIIDQSSSSSDYDLNYTWEFSNNASNEIEHSNETNPSFNYNVNGGEYMINLSVIDELGCEQSAQSNFVIEGNQDIDFAYHGVCLGATTEFTSAVVLSADEYITDINWSIDGNIFFSSELNNTHSFNEAGSYEICLTISTNKTCPASPLQHCEIIEIFSAPEALFSFNNSLCEHQEIIFQNESLSSSEILNSTWVFDNETIELENESSLSQVLKTYNNHGSKTISLTVMDENGCENSTEETITINETPTASFSYECDCVNQLVNFSCDVNNSSYSYEWYNETELIQSNSSSFDYDIQTSESFQAQLIVGNGVCFDTTSQLIELMPNQQIDIEISKELICKGDTINLSVLNPINQNITWREINENGIIHEYFGEEIELVLEHNALIKTYYNNTSLCIDTLSTTLEINEKPTANFDFISNCIQENIDLSIDTTLNNATQYFWTINEDIQMEGSHISFTPNSDDDNVSVELYSINTWGCSSTFSKNINIIKQPEIEFNRSQFNTCSGGYVELSLNNNDLITFSNVDSLSWLPNKNIHLDTDKNSLILYPETNTIYEFQVFNNNGECASNVSEIMVSIIQEPAIEINTAQLGSKFDISIDVFPYNVATDNLTWTDPTNTLFPLFGGNVTATPQQNTTYDLTLIYQIDESICTLDTTVSVKLDKFLLAPNVFSPNRDGKNDLFTLTSKGYDYIKNIAIFDRWGKIIYEGNNLMFIDGKMEKGWDGNCQKGESVNSSVYVYMYEAVCNNGEITKGSGNITLVK